MERLPELDLCRRVQRMTDKRAIALFLLGPWFNPAFWDDVEFDIGAVDIDDFEEFQESGQLPVEPRAEFVEDLHKRLRHYVRTRYGGHPPKSS